MGAAPPRFSIASAATSYNSAVVSGISIPARSVAIDATIASISGLVVTRAPLSSLGTVSRRYGRNSSARRSPRRVAQKLVLLRVGQRREGEAVEVGKALATRPSGRDVHRRVALRREAGDVLLEARAPRPRLVQAVEQQEGAPRVHLRAQHGVVLRVARGVEVGVDAVGGDSCAVSVPAAARRG